MKRVITILLLLAPVFSIIPAGTASGAWLHPKLLLPEAYPLAARALGSDTNHFACLNASWAPTKDAPDGKWLFVFVSTNGASRGVTVFSDRKTQVAPILSPP